MSFKSSQDIPDELRKAFIEYFFKFSRFEFALKSNNYLKEGPYSGATPDWNKFNQANAANFIPSKDAEELLAEPPLRQVVRGGRCDWAYPDLTACESDLERITLILRTIRNNLFHGGKSSHEDWDDPQRNLFLIRRGSKILDMLAVISGIEHDYWRNY